jgi:hypothetical protein
MAMSGRDRTSRGAGGRGTAGSRSGGPVAPRVDIATGVVTGVVAGARVMRAVAVAVVAAAVGLVPLEQPELPADPTAPSPGRSSPQGGARCSADAGQGQAGQRSTCAAQRRVAAGRRVLRWRGPRERAGRCRHCWRLAVAAAALPARPVPVSVPRRAALSAATSAACARQAARARLCARPHGWQGGELGARPAVERPLE